MTIIVPKLYLAGPEVFLREAVERYDFAKRVCHTYGFEAVVPLDGQTKAADLVAGSIYTANKAFVREADGVIADVSPWRGFAMDPGTAYEIGFADALGKPVFAWTSDPRDYRERYDYAGDVPEQDAEGFWRNFDGEIVEDFGLPDNLMPMMAAHWPERSAVAVEEAIVNAYHHFHRGGRT